MIHIFRFLVWILLCSAVAVAEPEEKDLPPFNMNSFGEGSVCPNYRCSSGMTPVPKSRGGLKFTSTGCSSMGSGMVMNTRADDEPEKEVYASCCDDWHACYQICGVSKKVCDDSFKTCATAKCGADDADCTKQIELSTMMMNLGGCRKFDQAQYQVCDCVAKDKAPAQRETAIRRFYKKYAPPGNEDKATELVKKADTASKLAALFRKLIEKYPDAIQKIEDPQQAMYRKMMQDAKQEGDKEKVTEEILDGDDGNEQDNDVQEL